MSHVIDSLRSGQNALLESPTGTGKTLCLLCATLAWRTTYVAALQAQAHMPSVPGMPTSSDKLFRNAGLHVNHQSTGSTSGASTGIALLSALAPRNSNNNNNNNAASESTTNKLAEEAKHLARPRIVYSSRTHSQLSQAIAELKKTEYKPAMSLVASRDQLCINDISNNLSGTRLNAMCRKIIQNGSKRRCRFYPSIGSSKPHENRSTELLTKLYSQPPMDIEELRSFGNKEVTCPFFLSRHSARSDECDVLFVPYNYLLDESIRGTLDIDWANDIIIIDEAHNLESICADAVSFDLTPAVRSACDDQLAKVIESGLRPNGLSIPALEGLINQGGNKGLDSVLGTENTVLIEVRVMRTILSSLETFINEAVLDRGKDSDVSFAVFPSTQLHTVFSESGGPTLDTYELYVQMLDRAIDLLVSEDGAGPQQQQQSSGNSNAIRVLQAAIRVLFESKSKGHESHFRTVIQQRNARGSGSSTSFANNNGRTLSYWCFKPAVAMKGLDKLKARCFLLTSGTLSPLDSFASELGLSFPIRLENPHVVTSPQVWAGVLRSAPDVKRPGPDGGQMMIKGGRLTSAYYARGDESSVDLGRAIIHITSCVPDGMLVFYPSYSSLYACVEVWKRLGPGYDRAKPSIWEHLLRIKRIVVEERDSSKMAAAILAHRANVDGRIGSILLAVCRGKVSEGIDFSDEYGRAVVITGLPYPSAFDPRVILKREFADEQARRSRHRPNSDAIDARQTKKQEEEEKVMNGAQWYTVQALRAVNQAIGRAIRHRYDYGAIVLCDERFRSIPLQGQISKWIRPNIKVFQAFADGNGSLDRFFDQAVQSEFAQEADKRRRLARKRQREAADKQRASQQRREEEDTNAVVLAQRAIDRLLPPPTTEAQFVERMLSISDEIKADKRRDRPETDKQPKDRRPSTSKDAACAVMRLSSQGAKGGLYDNGYGLSGVALKNDSNQQPQGSSLKRSAVFLASRSQQQADNDNERRPSVARSSDMTDNNGSKRARLTSERHGRYVSSTPRKNTEKLSEKIKQVFDKRDVRPFLNLFRELLAIQSTIGDGVGPLQTAGEVERLRQLGREKVTQIVQFTREKVVSGTDVPTTDAFLRELKCKIPASFQQWYEDVKK